MKKDYILFDLDGTLTDPKVGICTCAQYALADQGIMVENMDDLTAFIGPPLQYSFQKFYGMDEEQVKRAIGKFREKMDEGAKFENKVYPGIPEMLRKLKAQGFHLAVASSKAEDTVKEILSHFGIDRYFEAAVGSIPNAPDSEKEEVLEDALNRLFHYGRIRKAAVVMVGDRCFDVEAANALGLTSVAVRYGYAPEGELEEAEPDYIVSTVEELENLLLSKELQGEDFEVKEAQPEENPNPSDHREPTAATGNTGADAEQNSQSARRMDPKYFSTDDRKTGQTADAHAAGGGSSQSAAGNGGKSQEQTGYWKAEARNQSSRGFRLVWAFLYPFLLYYVMSGLAQQLLGYAVLYISQANDALYDLFFVMEETEEGTTLSYTGNGSAVVQILALIAVFFILYYFADGKKCLTAAKEKYGQSPQQKSFVWIVTALLLALGINLFFIGTGFTNVSTSYQEAASNLYAVGLLPGIILYGFFSPVVEEFLFRGIVLVQMDRYMSPTRAVVLSSLLFGVYHGNIIQGIYAFAIGAVLCMAYHDSGSFVLIAAIHGVINVIVFLMSSLELFPTGTAGITTGAVLIGMGVVCLDLVIKKERASRAE